MNALKNLNIEGEKIVIHMPMTGNMALTGQYPLYEVQEKFKSGGRRDLARFSVKKERVGYVIERYFYTPGSRPELSGFHFTAQGADEIAHRRALSLAERLSIMNSRLQVEDESGENIVKLLSSYRGIKGNTKDIGGEEIRDRFYRRE